MAGMKRTPIYCSCDKLQHTIDIQMHMQNCKNQGGTNINFANHIMSKSFVRIYCVTEVQSFSMNNNSLLILNVSYVSFRN